MQQTPIKYGLTTGAVMVLYLLLFYNLDKTYLFNPLVFWGSLLFPMVGMVIATRKVREEQGDELNKKQAISSSFITWVVAMAVFHIFMYLLFNVIDNGLIDVQQAMFEEATGEKLNREDFQMTPGNVTFRWAFMLLPGFLLAYTVASFLKNR